MRTTSAGERSQLAAASRLVLFAFFIKPNATDPVADLNEITGTSWLVEGTCGENIDQPCGSGTVTLFRGVDTDNLSPLMATSVHNVANGEPVLAPGRYCEIRFYDGDPADAVPPSSDWRPLFTGYIDEVDPAQGDHITLSLRDEGSVWVDATIERAAVYGAALGQPAEDVILAIAEDTLGTATLQVDDSPGFSVIPYQQDPMQLLEAAKRISDQPAFDLRQRFNASDVSVMTLRDPDRGRTTVDATIGPSEYRDVQALRISRADIRNAVEVAYFDSSGVEHIVGPFVDAASIGEFRRRFMRLTNDKTTNIDTDAEATAMGEAALSDLSWPFADQSLDMPFWWPAQLNDYYRFSANGQHYDSDQDMAVVGYTHSFSSRPGSTPSTSLQTRGKPLSAFKGWLPKDPVIISGNGTTIDRSDPGTIRPGVHGGLGGAGTPYLEQAMCVHPLWHGGKEAQLALGTFGSGVAEVSTDLRRWFDLTVITRARLVGRVATEGSADAVLRVECSEDGTTWTDLDEALTGPVLPLVAAGDIKGPWVYVGPLNLGDRILRLVSAGGDGVASPVIGSLDLQFVSVSNAGTSAGEGIGSGDTDPGEEPIVPEEATGGGDCNSTLSGAALFDEDYCRFADEAAIVTYTEAAHYVSPRYEKYPHNWPESIEGVIADPAYNGGHNAAKLIAFSTDSGDGALPFVEIDMTAGSPGMASGWARAVYRFDPAFVPVLDSGSDFLDLISFVMDHGAAFYLSIYAQGGHDNSLNAFVFPGAGGTGTLNVVNTDAMSVLMDGEPHVVEGSYERGTGGQWTAILKLDGVEVLNETVTHPTGADVSLETMDFLTNNLSTDTADRWVLVYEWEVAGDPVCYGLVNSRVTLSSCLTPQTDAVIYWRDAIGLGTPKSITQDLWGLSGENTADSPYPNWVVHVTRPDGPTAAAIFRNPLNGPGGYPGYPGVIPADAPAGAVYVCNFLSIELVPVLSGTKTRVRIRYGVVYSADVGCGLVRHLWMDNTLTPDSDEVPYATGTEDLSESFTTDHYEIVTCP